MKLHAYGLRRPAGAIAVLATAGLALTGCGTSSGSGSGSTTPSTSHSTPASQNSSSSSTGGSTTTSSASGLFPVAAGNTWTYKTEVGLTGSSGQTVDKMTAVTPVSAGEQVTMSTASTLNGTTTNSTAYYIFEPNGQISLPFSQFSSAESAGTQIKLISGGIFWPPAAELASGTVAHSTLKIKYVVGGQSKEVTSHVTVKGDGTGSVTVPAGTYSTTIVTMTMAEAVEGYNVSIEVKTWLATGVGPVQSEAIIDELGADHIVSEDQLVSFTKG